MHPKIFLILCRIVPRDVLTVTVLDRAASSSKDRREELLIEAKPLPCTHWGVGFGGRPALRTCTLVVPEVRAVLGAESSAPPVGAGAKAVSGEVSTVQLSIRWAPEMRLRKPLSLVAVVGGWTRRLLSCKVTSHSFAFAPCLCYDHVDPNHKFFQGLISSFTVSSLTPYRLRHPELKPASRK